MKITTEETDYIITACKIAGAIIARDYNRKADAADYAQELAVTALQAIAKASPTMATLRTYIAVVIRRGKCRIIRRILAERNRESAPADPDEPQTSPVDHQNNKTDVDAFRRTLPPDLKAIAADIIAGMTIAEMRKLHGLTTEQVRARIKKIRKAGLAFWNEKGTTDTRPV